MKLLRESGLPFMGEVGYTPKQGPSLRYMPHFSVVAVESSLGPELSDEGRREKHSLLGRTSRKAVWWLLEEFQDPLWKLNRLSKSLPLTRSGVPGAT